MYNDYILMFIDYLLIPFIALGIDLARSDKERKWSASLLPRYSGYVVAIAIIAYIIRLVVSRLGIGATTDPGTGIYTILATVIAVIVPYVRQIIATYCDVRCEIKGRKDSLSDEKQS